MFTDIYLEYKINLLISAPDLFLTILKLRPFLYTDAIKLGRYVILVQH